MLLNHTNKNYWLIDRPTTTTAPQSRNVYSALRRSLVIIWSLFHWRAPKHYYTVRMHIHRNIMCVCVGLCVCVCVNIWVCIFAIISASAWLTVHAIKDLFPNSIRLWPPIDPPLFLGHDTRSSVCKERVMCSVCVHELNGVCVPVRVHECMPPLACSWELWQRERRVQNMISSITHGVGG